MPAPGRLPTPRYVDLDGVRVATYLLGPSRAEPVGDVVLCHGTPWSAAVWAPVAHGRGTHTHANATRHTRRRDASSKGRRTATSSSAWQRTWRRRCWAHSRSCMPSPSLSASPTWSSPVARRATGRRLRSPEVGKDRQVTRGACCFEAGAPRRNAPGARQRSCHTRLGQAPQPNGHTLALGLASDARKARHRAASAWAVSSPNACAYASRDAHRSMYCAMAGYRA